MRIIILNIRGLGGRSKKSEIRELVAKEKVEFLCLQETKLDVVDERLAYILWGNSECNWVFSGSEGMSGGLCCIWDKDVFVRTELWGKKGLLGVLGLWKVVPVNLVNVYDHATDQGRKNCGDCLRNE